MRCERNIDCGCNDGREFCCPNDRRVFKHRHVVKHKHDEIHEYDVIHQHDHHIYDVVNVREEHRHHDHRRHKPDYCHENGCVGDGEGGWNGGGGGEIEIVSGNRCGCE